MKPSFFTINKKIIYLSLFSFLVFNLINAQQNENNFWNKVRYGGGLGLNLGDGFFSATIAPSAIYEFDENFAIGLGLNATFNNQKNIYKSRILGGSVLALYNVINEIQLSAEFEELNVNRRYNVNVNIPDENFWYPALFLGAGYRSGNVTFGIRYDILYDEEKSVYADPWIPFVRFFF